MYLLFISFTILSLNPIEDSQNRLLGDYLTALTATMHSASDSSDIANLTALYTDDVVYEHPKFGVRIESKEKVFDGMVSFIGSYGGKKSDVRLLKLDEISSQDLLVVKFSIAFKTSSGEEVSREQIQVIETEGAKISRIIDYW